LSSLNPGNDRTTKARRTRRCIRRSLSRSSPVLLSSVRRSGPATKRAGRPFSLNLKSVCIGATRLGSASGAARENLISSKSCSGSGSLSGSGSRWKGQIDPDCDTDCNPDGDCDRDSDTDSDTDSDPDQSFKTTAQCHFDFMDCPSPVVQEFIVHISPCSPCPRGSIQLLITNYELGNGCPRSLAPP
jgi:hypothetical protein